MRASVSSFLERFRSERGLQEPWGGLKNSAEPRVGFGLVTVITALCVVMEHQGSPFSQGRTVLLWVTFLKHKASKPYLNTSSLT